MKTFFKLFATLFLGLFIANCSNDVDMEVASQDAQTPVTRGVSAKTPKLTTYIETNDINPLNTWVSITSPVQIRKTTL